MKLLLRHSLTGQLATFEVAGKRIISVSTVTQGIPMIATLDNLKFNRKGIEQEFPDLKDKTWVEMKNTAISRLKEKLLTMKDDKECVDYIIEDLKKHSYEAMSLAQKGFRTKPI
jgi:hypothetical protein